MTVDGGAAALHGPAQLYVKPNLNTAGAVTLVTASNRVFQTRPLGVFWYNAQSGQAQLVAPVRDCVGQLVPPNQVVFKSAFGPLADLRLVYTKSGIESDLVLLQAPTPPAGWNPRTTRLELWHEWTGAPAPAQRPRPLYQESDPTLRSQMVDPDLTDHILDFGDLWFPTGAAYATDGSAGAGPNVARPVCVPNLARDPGLVGVAKTWLTTPSANVLVEGVRWPDIQAKLQGLPAASQPALPLPPQDRLTWLSQLPTPSAANSPGRAITLAAADYHPAGLVLDYLTVPDNWWGDYTFASGTTYLVTNNTYFNGGTVTFQPGCIIKFANAGDDLVLFGGIVCGGDAYNPSILTSKDDDVYGETDYGPNGTSTHCPGPVANPAIWDYYITTNVNLSCLKIRWAQTAIEFDGSSNNYCNGDPADPGVCGPTTNSLIDCELELCETGVYANECVVSLQDSWYCGVTAPTAVPSWNCQYCQAFQGTMTNYCAGTDPCNGLDEVWEIKHYDRWCVQGPSFVAECRPDRILLGWSLPPGFNGTISDFRLYRCQNANGSCTPTVLYQTITDTSARSYADQSPAVGQGSHYCYQMICDFYDCDSSYHEMPLSQPVCSQLCTPLGSVTANTAANGYGPIQTFSFSDGSVVNSFVPEGACDPNNLANGRGLAISGNEVFYTEWKYEDDIIHVCPYGSQGKCVNDTRTIQNTWRPGAGMQDLAFHYDPATGKEELYVLTGYDISYQPLEVFEIDPSTGQQVPGTSGITINATNGKPDNSADGFAVLPWGNFLINDTDGGYGTLQTPQTTYREYDGASGNLVPRGLFIDLSAYGFYQGRGVAMAPDGQSLYFNAAGSSGEILVQTDLTGHWIGFIPFDDTYQATEGIAVSSQ